MFSRLPQAQKPTVQVTVNGETIAACEGDSVASLLLTCDLEHTRTTAISGSPRGPFCLMGVCFECLVCIDGVPNQRACMKTIRGGMNIQVQQGSGNTI